MSITYDHQLNYYYCLLIINSAFGAGILKCIYKILTVWELSIILQKEHAQNAENNT